jgi:hypothetical protein
MTPTNRRYKLLKPINSPDLKAEADTEGVLDEKSGKVWFGEEKDFFYNLSTVLSGIGTWFEEITEQEKLFTQSDIDAARLNAFMSARQFPLQAGGIVTGIDSNKYKYPTYQDYINSLRQSAPPVSNDKDWEILEFKVGQKFRVLVGDGIGMIRSIYHVDYLDKRLWMTGRPISYSFDEMKAKIMNKEIEYFEPKPSHTTDKQKPFEWTTENVLELCEKVYNGAWVKSGKSVGQSVDEFIKSKTK